MQSFQSMECTQVDFLSCYRIHREYLCLIRVYELETASCESITADDLVESEHFLNVLLLRNIKDFETVAIVRMVEGKQ